MPIINGQEVMFPVFSSVAYKMKTIPKGGKLTIPRGIIALVFPYGDYTLSAHKKDGTLIAENMGTTMIFSTNAMKEYDNDHWVAFLYAKKITLAATVSSNQNKYTEECYIQNNYSGSSGSGDAYVYYIEPTSTQ